VTSVSSLNPATGDVRQLALAETSLAEVQALCARAASVAAEVATKPLWWRVELLSAMADELERDAASLVDLAMVETALARARLEGELRRTCFQLRFFGDVVRDGTFLAASIDHATESPMGPIADLRRIRVPLGPVAVFGSSNFPFAFSVPGGDTASALGAGCPVVIKAHPAHPATSQATFSALVRGAQTLGAPEGLLALVFGFEAGTALVEDPSITAVGFTGSVAAGRALWNRANARSTPIPFFGELGSANPLVVTPSAAAERASVIGSGMAASMTLGAGQFCTKPGLLFVPAGDDGDDVVATLAQALGQLAPMTMLAPSIASQFRQGVRSMAAVDGTTGVVGDDPGDATRVNAQLVEVTAAVFGMPASRALHEECFGPLAVVVRYRNKDELSRALSTTEPALTFSIFSASSDDDAAWLVALGQRRAGRVIANEFPTGVGVSWSMQHGGPWPATTAPAASSVGAAGIERWLRPVAFQNVPEALLPEALRDDNPLGVPQRVDGVPRLGSAP
jgi:NADP-dependent aldehyde dehydrogenase